MLYSILKIPARVAFHLYCRHLRITHKDAIREKGPLLITANHPNSFLDAIIIATIFRRPVHSLARGDVFINPLIRFILNLLNILPVYRLSEGAGNLNENYGTFDRCREILSKNGVVMIFSEGLCVNEWHLRTLKKGTARLAMSCWSSGIPLKVLPAGINYQSFTSFGKNVVLKFGKIINKEDIPQELSPGKKLLIFNELLHANLSTLVLEAEKNEQEKLKSFFYRKTPGWKKMLLWVPSLAGYIMHAPLYLPLKTLVKNKAGNSGHYDSILIAALFLLYPFYLLMITGITVLITKNILALLIMILLPLLAYCHIQLKKQFP